MVEKLGDGKGGVSLWDSRASYDFGLRNQNKLKRYRLFQIGVNQIIPHGVLGFYNSVLKNSQNRPTENAGLLS